MAIKISGTNAIDDNRNFYGNGNTLTSAPKIIGYTPNNFATGVSVTTNITIFFDQNIQFSGSGSIVLRSESPNGSIVESFVCGSSSRLTISGSQLIINLTNPLDGNKKYFLTLPSSSISNSSGFSFVGSSDYNFTTTSQFFIEGGAHSYTVASPSSPTGYFKYHIFTSSGPMVLRDPSASSPSLEFILVGGGGGTITIPAPIIPYISPPYSGNIAGGGGGGGVINGNGTSLGLSAGNYTVTIGGGGSPSTISGGPAGTTIVAYRGGPGDGPVSPITVNGVTLPGTSGASGGGGRIIFGGPAGGRVYGPGNSIPGQGTPGSPGYIQNPGGPPSSPTGYGFYWSGGGGGAGFSRNGPETSNGVNGGAYPSFGNPFINSYVPDPVLPFNFYIAIGSAGNYGGGGAGGSLGTGQPTTTPPSYQGSNGGLGGGGYGNSSRGSLYPTYNQFNFPVTGITNTGGGGAAASSFPVSVVPGSSGIFIIRYAIPF